MRRRGLFRYFSLVGLAYIVATLGTGLTSYLTSLELTKTTNLLVSGGVGLVTAMALGAIDLAKPAQEPDEPVRVPAAPGPGYPSQGYSPPGYPPRPGYPPPGYPTPGAGRGPARRRRSGTSIAVGAVLLLVLCGGGGYALTSGVTWAVDKVSELVTPPWLNKTKDPGVERLAGPASNTAGPLTLTVQSVRVNDKVTMIEVKAQNTGPDSLTLPVFKNAQLTTADATFEADPAAGASSISVGPGSEAFGRVVFDGVLKPGAAQVTMAFLHVMGSLNGPPSISVKISVS